MSLLISLDAPYGRCWRASHGDGWPMQTPKCFLLQSSFSTKPGSKSLADDLPLTSWHKPPCSESPQPRIFCRHCRLQIPAGRSPHPLALSCWCSSPAVTRGKHHEFSNFSIFQFCRPAWRLGTAHEKAQKIWLWASDFVWSWCICCLNKLCRRERSF